MDTIRRLPIASIEVDGDGFKDCGIGIIISRRPFRLLVPTHVIESLLDQEKRMITFEGVRVPDVRIIASPALNADHLSIVQLPQRARRSIEAIALPRKQLPLHPGQPVHILRPDAPVEARGEVLDIRDRGEGVTIITNIPIENGDSGSPMLIDGRLAGVCQGMIQQGDARNAVAIPLSEDSLTELRRYRRQWRLGFAGFVGLGLLALLLSFGAFAIYSSSAFQIESIEVKDDGSRITAYNAQQLTIFPSWTRSFETSIRRSHIFSTSVSGRPNRVAVGIITEDNENGGVIVLDSTGRERWRYQVPDGECIYSSPLETFDRFWPTHLVTADLDFDGHVELLVSFVHEHFYPCKLVVFSHEGDVLAEYWHPGYIRTLDVGKVGDDPEPLILISASNNRIRTDWWNPQTLFAFRGLNIYGQAPPYTGERGRASHRVPAPEIWYWVIENMDPEILRAKCKEFDFVDIDGDGDQEIRAPLTDGRFYYLDEAGDVLSIDLADRYLRDFASTPPPPLVAIEDAINRLEPRAPKVGSF